MTNIYKAVFDERDGSFLMFSSFNKARFHLTALAKDHGYEIESFDKDKYYSTIEYKDVTSRSTIEKIQVH